MRICYEITPHYDSGGVQAGGTVRCPLCGARKDFVSNRAMAAWQTLHEASQGFGLCRKLAALPMCPEHPERRSVGEVALSGGPSAVSPVCIAVCPECAYEHGVLEEILADLGVVTVSTLTPSGAEVLEGMRRWLE